MPVYTVQFFASHTDGGAEEMFLIPDDGATWVLRDIVLGSGIAGAGDVVVYDNHSYYYFNATFTGNNQTAHLELRQVLPPGTDLYNFSDITGYSVLGTGYRLL